MTSLTKNFNRQDVKVAVVDINLSELVQNTAVEAIDLPPNAVILAGNIVTTEAFNSTTSDVLDVGDGASATRYLTDGNIRALNALVALVPTGFVHLGGPLTITWTSGGGTPTTGKARLTVQYIQLGRSESTFG